ncbi:MAG: DUF2007 domain-containing protein [Phycisphaerae bacterium]|jgi:hypothetical protein
MADEPVCVRRANTIEEAEIIVAWLEEQGIEAKIGDPSSTGVMAFGVTDTEGVEILVADEKTAERARKALADHDSRPADDDEDGPLIEVTCDECKHVNRYPADDAGTTQECAECGGYVDVPGEAE